MKKSWAPAALLPLIALFAGLAAAPAVADRSGSSPLRIEFDTQLDYIDPALAYYTPTWQLENATCAKLVKHPDLSPPAGSLLEPEIAAAMPTVSADGRTYTFQIRNDYAFSPPATGVVTAASMKYTFERTLDPDQSSPAQPFYLDIVGVPEYINRTAQTITGIVASGNTLTISLTEPAGDFLARLAMPFMCAVPTSLPVNPDGVPAPVPSAGPYYISVLDLGRLRVRHCAPQPELHGAAPTPVRLDPVHLRLSAGHDSAAHRSGRPTSDRSRPPRTRSWRNVRPRQRGRRKREPAVVHQRRSRPRVSSL